MRPIDIFHIGPQKSGTTWLYENLKQHPDIAVPRKDTVHFFDINYVHGKAWVRGHYDDIGKNQKIFDPTFTYIRSPLALHRIYDHNPNARIALTLRHPLERAYSHYWHEFKKGTVTYPFEACLRNYDLFQNWIEPGLPITALKILNEYFGKDQVMILMYEDMKKRPLELLRDLFVFYDVDEKFAPLEPEKVINAAGHKRDLKTRVQEKLGRSLKLDKRAPAIYEHLSGRSQYKKGMKISLRDELMIIIKPMIEELQDISGKDLSHWS